MQRPNADTEANIPLDDMEKQKQRLASCLFPADHPSVVWNLSWQSTEASQIINFVSSQIESLHPTYITPFLKAIDPVSEEFNLEAAFRVASDVATIVLGASDRQTSIGEISSSLVEKFGAKITSANVELEEITKQAIFALIGCITTLYQPSAAPGLHFEISFPSFPRLIRPTQRINSSGRPLYQFLQAFGPLTPSRVSSTAESTNLVVSTLNIALLRTDIIGNVKISWVNTLSSHLDFDEETRILKLFRFPTFCALYCQPEAVKTCFDFVVDNHQEPESTTFAQNASFHREVLLSFRLIFGQTRKSRRHFNTTEFRRAHWEGTLDPVLSALCGHRASIETHIVDGSVRERPVYNSSTHFPCLGSRLAAFQKYVTTRKPSNIRQHWKDRRDRFEWFAFWALFIIGALSVATSIVQIALSAARLQVTLHPVPA